MTSSQTLMELMIERTKIKREQEEKEDNLCKVAKSRLLNMSLKDFNWAFEPSDKLQNKMKKSKYGDEDIIEVYMKTFEVERECCVGYSMYADITIDGKTKRVTKRNRFNTSSVFALFLCNFDDDDEDDDEDNYTGENNKEEEEYDSDDYETEEEEEYNSDDYGSEYDD